MTISQDPAKSTRYPPVTLTEFKGTLFLHLGTDWIQGAMRLGKPNEIVLDYVQNMMIWMLFKENPSHIVQLGLGSGALTKFCYQHFINSRITAVELNPEVINVCRSTFFLPDDDERLTVIQTNALDYIESQKHKKDIDILQVDLYDENARLPLFDTLEFYGSCYEAMSEDGIMLINIFGKESDRSGSIERLREHYEGVVWLEEVDGGNVIVVAFKRAPEIYFEELRRRATRIRRETKLKSLRWVGYLEEWMRITE